MVPSMGSTRWAVGLSLGEGFLLALPKTPQSHAHTFCRLPYDLPPVCPTRPSRFECARLATFSTMMEAQRDGSAVHAAAYLRSGPHASPCCQHSALAETMHRMGTDVVLMPPSTTSV
ncbi:hypothetical protein M3J09_007384 [Ascochyta lentis]